MSTTPSSEHALQIRRWRGAVGQAQGLVDSRGHPQRDGIMYFRSGAGIHTEPVGEIGIVWRNTLVSTATRYSAFITIYREQPALVWMSSAEAALAIGEASAGEIDAGLRRLDDALAELERTEERSYEAEMHRIRAEILLQRDLADTAAAEQFLQATIAIAQSQKARSFERRAALSLAKLYRSANCDTDAYAVLAPAVEGFPPTREFPELTEAQTLLSALTP